MTFLVFYLVTFFLHLGLLFVIGRVERLFLIERYRKRDERFVHASRHSPINRTRQWVTPATLEISTHPWQICPAHIHTRVYMRATVTCRPGSHGVDSPETRKSKFFPNAIDLGTVVFFLAREKRKSCFRLSRSRDLSAINYSFH